MTTFLDTSALYGALDAADPGHARARAMFSDDDEPRVVSDVVLTELWRVTRRKLSDRAAEAAVVATIASGVKVEGVTGGDVLRAVEIGEEFPDQGFSFADRTSFALMHRLGVYRVATLDHHFAVYRFGPGRRRAFAIAG